MRSFARCMGKPFLSVLCLCMLLSFGVAATAADDTVNIIINGKAVAFTEDSGYPYSDENGRTMVPLRVTMEAAGTVVGWDQGTQTAIVITEHDRIEITVGTDYLYNNNKKILNDTYTTTKNGRVYLPIRAVLESADFTVEWDNATRTVSAYTFDFDENAFVPYSTSSLSTLVKNILAGKVIYVGGQYYTTPAYVKMLSNTQIDYSGSDLNTAIYPTGNDRYDLADKTLVDIPKEWVSEMDLSYKNIRFSTFGFKGFSRSGVGTSTRLYATPDVPEDMVTGVFNGISFKIENEQLLFKQEDLLTCNVLDVPITETVWVKP